MARKARPLEPSAWSNFEIAQTIGLRAFAAQAAFIVTGDRHIDLIPEFAEIT
jgi:hypothetical protein